MSMTLEEQKNWWDGAARENAPTAILSNEANWDMGRFYASGDEWLRQHVEFARGLGVELGGERSLDFGCGMGRMTMALGKLYTTSVGADISPEMIDRANESAVASNVEFSVQSGYPMTFPDGSFNLVYSTIVVQHISQPHNLEYIKEFFRITKSGGYVLFDAPAAVIPGTDAGAGIFISPESEVRRIGDEHGSLVGERVFPATATYHLQYLFRKR